MSGQNFTADDEFDKAESSSTKEDQNSPEKVAAKRPRPNPTTPTKAIDIKKKSGKNQPENQIDGKLPLWVAGASPAKFIALEDIIKVNSAIEKMAIVHEIAVDPNFSVEDLQRKDPVYTQVKSTMHKAYWKMLEADIEKDPPDYIHALTLLNDLRLLLKEQLSTTGNLSNAIIAVEEVLNPDHLATLFKRKLLDFEEVLRLVLKILQNLCAPARDEFVRKLCEEKDLVLLFKGVFELVEFMKLDMANYALSKNRNTIESYSAEIEREEFMKAIQHEQDGAIATKLWLRRLLDDFLAHESSEATSSAAGEKRQLTKQDIAELITQLYLSLLEVSEETELTKNLAFPETLRLDAQRLMGLSEKYLQLILTTAAGFIASNLAGKSVCEGTDFKAVLKNELIVILNDVSLSNYSDKLENVFLQCQKNVQQHNDSLWTEEKSRLLKEQILNLRCPSDTIRLIARNRVRQFLHQVLQKTGELRLPPGLSVIQSELAAFTSKFYAIVVHNWKTFGPFYAEILQELFTAWLQK